MKITGIFKFLFFGTWLLMTTILVYSYQTTLISHLTVTRLKPIPHSFEDLANEPNLKLTVERDYILTQSILVNFLFNFNINSSRLKHLNVVKKKRILSLFNWFYMKLDHIECEFWTDEKARRFTSSKSTSNYKNDTGGSWQCSETWMRLCRSK